MNTMTVPPTAEALCRRIATLIESGRTGTARPLLAAAQAMTPAGAPELALLAARLSLRDGDHDTARHQLDAAIARFPADGGLWKCRADAHLWMHHSEAAARDASEAVVLDRDDPEAKALLGTALLALGRVRDAVACLDEAIATVPDAPKWREALAAALEADGDVDTALRVLHDGMALAPSNIGLRNAAMLVCIRRHDFRGAVRLAQDARMAGIGDACTFGMMGHALASLGDHESASNAYQEALKLGPQDAYVRHLVMAAGALPSATRAPPEYVSTVFDGYADRFETHLVSLGYAVPVRIREILFTHPAVVAAQRLGPALDLGCGTGLVALAVSDLAIGPITGVDLSGRMLDHARVKCLYDDLRHTDIMDVLTGENDERWSLITAADVLVYFGALEDVLAAVQARLEPGGWFVFSLEDLEPGGRPWKLHRLGRYAHTADYVHQALAAAGLCVLRSDRVAVRQEAGAAVQGMLIVAERPRHDG
jgi:predicted TPR repeat methyltransferase/thioredoxin-like negative regulator of GroEL